MRALVRARADLRATDSWDYNAMALGAALGRPDIIAVLVEAGASPSQRFGQPPTFPLMAAAWMGHADVCTALLAAAASVNATNKWNRTAAHWAAAGGMGFGAMQS